MTTTLNEALADYYELRSGSYSPSTWKAHENQLERMRAALTAEFGPNCRLSDLDCRDGERVMVRYFNRLRPPTLAASSFNNYRQYCMMFWLFARGESWVKLNPMRHVDPERVVKRVRLQLGAEELLELLDGASPRDRMALALAMNTGLRAGDLMKVKVGDVDFRRGYINVFIQKTKKWDELPITAELRDELNRWLRHYATETGHTLESLPNEWTLMPPRQGLGYAGPGAVYKTDAVFKHPETIVQAALERLGLPTQHEGFHTIRRSAARAMFDLAVAEGVGDPIRMPQALLGHASRATTEGYLGITHEKRMRDELLRGNSFLGKRADADKAARENDERGELSA